MHSSGQNVRPSTTSTPQLRPAVSGTSQWQISDRVCAHNVLQHSFTSKKNTALISNTETLTQVRIICTFVNHKYEGGPFLVVHCCTNLILNDPPGLHTPTHMHTQNAIMWVYCIESKTKKARGLYHMPFTVHTLDLAVRDKSTIAQIERRCDILDITAQTTTPSVNIIPSVYQKKEEGISVIKPSTQSTKFGNRR